MLKPQQVADKLSVPQFIKLCGWVDTDSGPNKRFDVLEIHEKDNGGKEVLVEFENGHTRWYVFVGTSNAAENKAA